MSRVTEIRYVGYGVENFDAERAFYKDDWGLVEVDATADMAWFKTHGHDEHHVVRLHKAEVNHIEVIALAADTRADVDELFARIEAAGCKVIFAPRELDAPGGGYGFRFFSPDGSLSGAAPGAQCFSTVISGCTGSWRFVTYRR